MSVVPLPVTALKTLHPGDEAGRIVGVAADCWNGMVLVQAPAHAAALARKAARRSRRPVSGLSGPWDQVVAARAALALDPARTTKDSREELHVLDLANLSYATADRFSSARHARNTSR